MHSPLIDEVARELALGRNVIPPCLHVPIAAVDEAAIRSYVGEIVQTLSGRGTRRAFLVRAYAPPPVDKRFPIWDQPASAIFHQPAQVWVHIGFTRYRQAWRRAFPDEVLGEAGTVGSPPCRASTMSGSRRPREPPTPAARSPKAGVWLCTASLIKWRPTFIAAHSSNMPISRG